MNGARTNARRRARASASLAASGKNDDSNESIYNVVSNGENKGRGRRRKSDEKAQVQLRRYVRRKGKNISRIKQMCSKIGKLRVLDVMVFIGLAFKLASIIYSRRVPSSTSTTPVHPDPLILLEPESTAGEVELVEESLSDNKLPSPPKEWVKRWAEHRMPFHSPLLYRREDDDYSFGYDSYPEDDDGGDDRSEQRNKLRQQKQKLGLKGMLLREYPADRNVEQLNGYGYAVVDDVLYNVDGYREYTVWALDESEFQLNDPVSLYVDFVLPAFGISNAVDEDDAKPPGHFIDDDNWDPYYAFDDDIVRGTLGMATSYSNSTADFDDVCTAPSFYRTYQPNCNEFHASLSGYQWLFGEELFSRRWKKKKHLAAEKSHLAKYLSSGYFRDAFMFQPSFVSYDGKDKPSTQWDEVVFKTMRHMFASSTAESNDDGMESLGFGFDPEDKYTFLQYQEDMRKDAMVMELLSSSPRVTDIYAHCSMSSVIEFVPVNLENYILPTLGYSPKKILRGGSEESEREEPLNDHITPEEKLEIALEMAKCLAAMHGYEDGVIAHVDLQLGQFMRGRDGLIKIVDFNRAEPLLYDTNNEKYCAWCNGVPPDGVYRAPEENVDAPLTEKIDVYSLGNIFYSILTGKLVWADVEHEELSERIIEGYLLEIPDFYEENKASENLVIAIKACWNYEVDDRPSIFRVVEFLEDAVASSRK